MDNEVKKRIADFFEGFELVEYLQISSEEVIERFSDEIIDALEDINELMGVREDEA